MSLTFHNRMDLIFAVLGKFHPGFDHLENCIDPTGESPPGCRVALQCTNQENRPRGAGAALAPTDGVPGARGLPRPADSERPHLRGDGGLGLGP